MIVYEVSVCLTCSSYIGVSYEKFDEYRTNGHENAIISGRTTHKQLVHAGALQRTVDFLELGIACFPSGCRYRAIKQGQAVFKSFERARTINVEVQRQ
jgi:hypothetical protein